jgi:hypothetical protein
MIAQIVLKQTAGGSLKFSPNQTLGFTKGGNYVTISVPNYGKTTHVNLGFNENQPSNAMQSQYSTGTFFDYTDVATGNETTVNPAIATAVAQSAIAYLKSFNSTAEFEVSDFAPLPV